MADTPSSTPLLLKGYRIATGVFAPFSPLLLAWRASKDKEDAARRGERQGVASLARPQGTLIWIHAASVGETNAALPLILALRKERPNITLLLTTGTVTSAALAAARMPDGVIHQYVPLDVPAFTRTFLDHWAPDLALFAESEIWPNLIIEASSRGIPLALVNARMSERSFARWMKRPRLAKSLFGRFGLVLAQTQAHADRFSKLGADDCVAAGNLKIDAPPPLADPAKLKALKTEIGKRPVFLAASTHPGEEKIVAEAHKALAQRHERLLTIIVPRHPARGREVADVVRSTGLQVAQRSQNDAIGANTEIYVADTIGELGLFYASSPVAFIGGSLVRHGGQNPIEAIRHGTAVITGPEVHNFATEYDALKSAGGCVMVTSGQELEQAADRFLSDEKGRETCLQRAGKAINAMSGALDITLEALKPLMPEKENSRAGADK